MTKISNQYSLTNILTADLANSRLGINNVSPTVALDVTGAGKFSGALTLTGALGGTSATFSGDVSINSTNSKTGGTAWNLNIRDNTALAANIGGGISFQGVYTTGGSIGNFGAISSYKTNATSGNESGGLKFYYSANGIITQGLQISETGAATFSSSVTATSSSFPLDVYGTTNNYGIRINSVQAPTLLLYSSNANAGNRNWGIFTNSNVYGDFDIRQSNAKDGDMTVGANSTSRLYIKNDGNVGIGTSSPSELMVIYGLSTSRPRLIVGPITTSTALYSTYNSQDNPSIEVNTNTTNGFAGLTMSNSNNTSGNTLGAISYVASGTSASDKRGAIIFSSLESVSTSSVSANLIFYTNNANSIGERMRISAFGNVGIGRTFPNVKLVVSNNDAVGFEVNPLSSGCDVFVYNRATSAYAYMNLDGSELRFSTAGSEKMRFLGNGNLSIGTTGDVGAKIYIVGTTSYGIVYQNASVNNFYVGVGGDGYLRASAWSYGSDIRMKENILDVTNGLDLVSKLKPKHFDYIDGIKNNLGFIAQDVQELIPQAVSISDKKTGMLGLKTDFIIPYLTKAIQELSAENTSLINRIEALENK